MSPLVVLAVLVGTALAAPQLAYRPAPYKPVAYAAPAASAAHYPFAAAKPLAYSAPAYAAPAYAAPAYNAPAYNAPAYASPAFSAYKPAYSAPAYTPQSIYSPQPQYSSQYARPIAIVRQSQDDNFDGSFTYDFEGENGIASQASGYLKNPGTDAEAQVIQGQYSYTAPDGTPVVTRYYADETGFHADGSHIPTAAPADPYRTA